MKLFALCLILSCCLAQMAHLFSGENRPELKKATFAGGCFWCMQPAFDRVKGVVSTTVGYTGGHTDNPTYPEVSAGNTGHAESIEVTYDPSVVGYDELLDVFWHNIDPTTADRQFCDIGNQYRSAIFTHDAQQQAAAEASKRRLIETGLFSAVATEITPASTFYPAEEYHQEYYKKNPIRYKFYRYLCGRDKRLDEVWGKFKQ